MTKQNLLKLFILLLALTLTLTGCLGGGSLDNTKDQTVPEFLQEVTATYRSRDLKEIEKLFHFTSKEDKQNFQLAFSLLHFYGFTMERILDIDHEYKIIPDHSDDIIENANDAVIEKGRHYLKVSVNPDIFDELLALNNEELRTRFEGYLDEEILRRNIEEELKWDGVEYTEEDINDYIEMGKDQFFGELNSDIYWFAKGIFDEADYLEHSDTFSNINLKKVSKKWKIVFDENFFMDYIKIHVPEDEW